MTVTVPDPVRQHADARPDTPALVTGAETWTWADLDARVSGTAARLAEGGERVAVRAETSPDLVVLVLAALRTGRLLVPLSTRWTPAAVADALGRLGIDRLLSDEAVPGVETAALADVVQNGERREASAVPLGRPFTVVHTSGSTGEPKAVVHTVGNHVWSARGVVEALGVTERSRWLLDLPLYHVGGLGVVVRCALAGATLAVPPRAMPLADRVARLRPTHASLVATQLGRLLDAGADLSGLDAVLLGGSAIPADLLDRAVAADVPVVVSYGMTEMTSTITATAPGDDRAALATSGRSLPHRAVRISDAGEIEVGGPTLADVLGPDGVRPFGEWHPTGDLGHLDAEGRLVVTGRRDVQFVSGGENVRPERVEAALLALDGVAEAVVVPVPDAEFGARPVAFVRPAGGAQFDADALTAALRRTLPGFMVPVSIHTWAGAEGLKPDRPALARRAQELGIRNQGPMGTPDS
ncbi:AMP-binding protein [Rubrivirga sp.]|uniref:AMP-binding protein n=1 Tax=Rubrivirga sp. TaxID=1885344 RepID=UPI003B52980B